jgi:acyl-[acyl-carrier-protein]-phospholipid O-acyltransferase/long-chain-fatty-acid--[acyl-carrier-protein] ligase
MPLPVAKDAGVKDEAPVAPNPYEPPASSPPGDVQAARVDHSRLPSLFKDGSFYGLTLTQFLGAFNDNLFKQLMLLLAVPIAGGFDKQGVATMVFSAPFILFSGYAGYLADRYSKRNIIVYAKFAEIGIMLLGMIGFLMFQSTGYLGLLCVLFLMGTHSAFFGPSKYGILPELFRGSDLPRANGIVVMTTFLAIIFGTATAGAMKNLLVEHNSTGVIAGDKEMLRAAELPENKPEEHGQARGTVTQDASRLWPGSLACIGVAIVGTICAFSIRLTPRAVPELKFRLSSMLIPPDTRESLWQDPPLMWAILASSMFWLVSGITVQVVNFVGKKELGLSDATSDTWTSVLNACTGLGIVLGAGLAGKLSKGKANFGLMQFGAWGIVVTLVLLGLFRHGEHLIPFHGTWPLMIVLGAFAAMFAIPVQVFIQARPSDEQKGRVVAVMNLANFAAILLAGAIYSVFDLAVNAMRLPHTPIFILTALIILPVALLYRPKDVELAG